MTNETKPAESSAIEKLVPGVEHFKKVFANNRERVDRALLVTAGVKEILPEDETGDLYANNVLVKCGVTFKEIQAARLGATAVLDDAKAWAMGPEKELQAEMDRIKKLRNDRLAIIKARKDEEEAKIKAEEAYTAYEGKIKSAMKASMETGIAKKLSDLEEALASLFNKVTLDKFSQLEKTLSTTKPGLKEDFYSGLFNVPYDQNIMSVEKFEALVGRAKSYDAWKFDNINNAYVKTALEIIAKWKDKLPQKKRELEKIAQGGADAEKLKQQAEARAKSEEAQRKEQEAQKQKEIEENRITEEQKAVFDAQFNSQVAQQKLNEQSAPSGTRTKKVYRISPAVEVDFVKLSSLLAKLFLNLATDPSFKLAGGIFKKDKDGNIKKNEQGEPEYVEGIQFWLTQAAKLPYTPQVEGLVSNEVQATVAKVIK